MKLKLSKKDIKANRGITLIAAILRILTFLWVLMNSNVLLIFFFISVTSFY